MQIYSLYPILYPELLKLHIHLVHGFCIYMSYNHFKLNIFITKFLLPLPSQSVSHPGFPTTIQPEAEAQNSVVIFDFSFSHSSFAIFGKSHWIFEMHSKSNHFSYYFYPNPRTFNSHLNYFYASLAFSCLSATTLTPNILFLMQPCDTCKI